MLEEGERLKLLRAAVWGDEQSFLDAIKQITKE